MLAFAFVLLSATVLLGLLAALMQAKGWAGRRFGWLVGVVHGLLGAAGLLLLLRPVLAGRPRAVADGTGNFGVSALLVLGFALLLGLVFAVQAWRRRPAPSLVIGLHATVALLGYLVLAAWIGGAG